MYKKIVIIILSIVIVMLLIIFGFILINNKNKNLDNITGIISNEEKQQAISEIENKKHNR